MPLISCKFDQSIKETMSAKKELLAQYDLHNVLFNTVIADISDEESNKQLLDPMNSVKWIAGHLLWAQGNLARTGGVEVTNLWVAHFAAGPGASEADLNAPKGEMPTLQMLKDKWNEIAPAIRVGLENLPEEALDSPIQFPLPMFNTVAGLWAFMNHHQAYHIGQIGVLRRGLGKEPMKYSL
jgi:uncharacterized damage-inducible protein DinB